MNYEFCQAEPPTCQAEFISASKTNEMQTITKMLNQVQHDKKQININFVKLNPQLVKLNSFQLPKLTRCRKRIKMLKQVQHDNRSKQVQHDKKQININFVKLNPQLVKLNLFQLPKLTRCRKRIKMLKQVQHDRKQNEMLNQVQHNNNKFKTTNN
jgi:acetolactate synthase regulatory subunit